MATEIFNKKDFLNALESAESSNQCKKVPLPEIAENQNYVFVSYSHKDFKDVFRDLADLYEAGVYFWYDKGLPAGKDWENNVQVQIESRNCAGVIFYISENFFSSDSCLKEVETVYNLKKNSFAVNLQSERPSTMIYRTIKDEGNIDFLGLAKLQETFPDRNTYLSFDNCEHSKELLEQIKKYNVIGEPPFKPKYIIVESNCQKVKKQGSDVEVREGNGWAIFDNGNRYDGNWEDDEINGYGTMTYKNGECYSGFWKNGICNGHGKYSWPNGAYYDGEWKDGKCNGHGKYIYSGGSSYDGEWKDGKKNGKGIKTYPDGEKYDGEWKDDRKNGHGKCIYPNGSSYDGEWKDGRCNGYGKLTLPDGSYYEGEWEDDEFSGHGKFTCYDGSYYEGDFKNGAENGFGEYQNASKNSDVDHEPLVNETPDSCISRSNRLKYFFGNIHSFYGEWEAGFPCGKGEVTYADGHVEEKEFSRTFSFVIPNGITEISSDAFLDCCSLKKISIPNSVHTIGNFAFQDCEALSEVVVPNSVHTIGECAFGGCKSLSKIVIPNSVHTIGESAFIVCEALSKIVIPNSVHTIGTSAFHGCIALSEVVIPNSVHTIGESAFAYCIASSKVVIPDSVTTIGNFAFQGCEALSEVVIPNSVHTIGEEAFLGCHLKKVTLSKTLYSSLSDKVFEEKPTSVSPCPDDDCVILHFD